MLDQISSWWRQLSTKQCSGNKCRDVLTKIQTSNYTMDHLDWPVNSGGLSVKQLHSLDSALFAYSQAFLKAYFIYIFCFMYPFFFKIVHYYVSKTESLLFCCQFCRQSACRRQHYYSGGSRGAQHARPPPPPKIGSTVIFNNPFCIRMLKNRAQLALESIKNP